MKTQSQLRDRAENYTFREIGSLEILNKELQNSLEIYLKSNLKHPLLVCGPKGYGKTHNILNLMNRCVKRSKNFIPAVFNYSQNSGIRLIHPYRIASSNEWGRKLEHFSDFVEAEEILDRANPIVLDNIHYACEDAINGKRKIKYITEFLQNMLSRVEEGKKFILISENDLSFYAARIRDVEFDRVLPKLGDYNPKKRYQHREEMDYMAKIYVSPLGFYDWSTIFPASAAAIDDISQSVIFNLSTRPRFAIRMINLIGRDITYDKVRENTLDIIKSKLGKSKGSLLSNLTYYVQNYPGIVFGGMKIEDFRTLNKYLKDINLDFVEEKMEIIDDALRKAANILGLPKGRKTKIQEKLWLNNPRYALKKSIEANLDAKLTYSNEPNEILWEKCLFRGAANLFEYVDSIIFSACKISEFRENWFPDLKKLREFYMKNYNVSKRVLTEYVNIIRNYDEYHINYKNYSQSQPGIYVLDKPFRIAFSELLYQA